MGETILEKEIPENLKAEAEMAREAMVEKIS